MAAPMDKSLFTLLVVCIWSSYECTVETRGISQELRCTSITDFAVIDEEFVFAACNVITELSSGDLQNSSNILVYDIREPLQNGRGFYVGQEESSILVATYINNNTVTRIRLSPDYTKIAAIGGSFISIYTIQQLDREVNLTFLNTHWGFSSPLQNFDWICSDRLLVASEGFLVIASAETNYKGEPVAWEGALGLQVTPDGAYAYATTTSGFTIIPLDSSYDIPTVNDETAMEGAPFIDLAIDTPSEQTVFLLNSTALISNAQTFTLSAEPQRLKERGGTVLVFGTRICGLLNAGHFESIEDLLGVQLNAGAITLNEIGMPTLILAGVSECSVYPSTTTGGTLSCYTRRVTGLGLITTGCIDDGCCFKPTPNAVCIDGVWVVNMTDVIRGNVTITGGETLVVIGDLILNGSVVIVIESGQLDVKGDLISDTTGTIIMNSQNTLNVDGHLQFNGSIVVNVGTRIPTGEIIIVTFNTSSGIPQIIVNAEPEECTILTTTPQQRERSYAVLFSVQMDESSPECLNSDETNDDWIWIVIGVSIGVIVIAVAIGVFFFVRMKLAI